MYTVTTEQSFDSAHFLAGYKGKCKNIHGHRWRVLIKVGSEQLEDDGMVVDFKKLKRDLKEMAEYFDHCFIIEKDSLKPGTQQALLEEGFRIVEVAFRPTAEHFSKYFYDKMSEKGYAVQEAIVYETPNNCASYHVR